MSKITAAVGVLVLSHSLVAAQTNPINQSNSSFSTSNSLSSTLTLPPFPISNATSSSVSPPLVGSGTSSIPSETAANSTTPASVATGSTTVRSDLPGTSRGTPTSSHNVGTTSFIDQSNTTSSSQTISFNSDGSVPTIVTVPELNSTVSQSFSSTPMIVPGQGTLPFPTTTSPASLSEDLPVAATFTGAWKDTSTLSPVSFTWFNIPTMTISDAPEETSESKLLGGLFFALRANRRWLQDPKLKVQYLDNVKKTQEEVIALLGKLSITPPTVPGCSGEKRKRGALSEVQLRALLHDRGIIPDIGKAIKGAIGDIGKLISCAHDVVTKLTKTVEGIEENMPDLGEIEDLTDTLAEIGKDLEEEKDDDESSSTTQQSSTTPEGSTSSSSSTSCAGSTAVPICTEIVSLSTSYMPGATSIFTVATNTQTSCVTTTISGCTEIGTTTTTTGSISSASSLSVSVSQEIYYYGSDSEAAVTSLASQIEVEQANLGCVTNWNQPTPTAGCNLSGLKAPTNSASVLTILDLNSIKSSIASATGPISPSVLSSVLYSSSTLRVSASATGANSNVSISSTQSVNPRTSTFASGSGPTLITPASSSGIHSTLNGPSSTAAQNGTTPVFQNSDTNPTFASSNPVSGQSTTNTASLTFEGNRTFIGSTSSTGQAKSNSASSVPNPNPTLVGSSSTSFPGESTSTSVELISHPTIIGSISSSGQGDSTSAFSLSGASSTIASSTSATVSAKTASQPSSTGVPSTLVTLPSSTSLASDTLLTLSSTSSRSGTSAASLSQTSSTNTNSAILSTSQTSLSTFQSVLTSSSSATLPSKITVTQDTIRPLPTLTPANCRGIDNNNWISRDLMASGIKGFCEYAGAENKHDDNSGSITSTFWGATINNATNFWIDWPQGISLQEDECLRNMNSIMDNCDGVPSNPGNWKHGGNITYGQFTYHIEPTFDRGYQPGKCVIEFSADRKWHGYDVSSVTLSDNADIARVKPPNDFSVMQQADGPPKIKLMSLSYDDLNMTLSSIETNSQLLFKYGTLNWTMYQDNCGEIGTFDGTNGLHMICEFSC